jgi:hypothetical protein
MKSGETPKGFEAALRSSGKATIGSEERSTDRRGV